MRAPGFLFFFLPSVHPTETKKAGRGRGKTDDDQCKGEKVGDCDRRLVCQNENRADAMQTKTPTKKTIIVIRVEGTVVG